MAAAATGGRLAELRQGQTVGQEVRGRPGGGCFGHDSAYSLDRGIRDRPAPVML